LPDSAFTHDVYQEAFPPLVRAGENAAYAAQPRFIDALLDHAGKTGKSPWQS
jgi:hypothetical protein